MHLVDVFKDEFLKHMVDIGHAWCHEDGRPGSMATWLDAKNRALQALAHETYGPDSPPYRLISRKDHSAYKECAECRRLRLDVARLLKEGKDLLAIDAAKKLQADHRNWYMTQREKLEAMRQSGLRNNTIFEQACTSAMF